MKQNYFVCYNFSLNAAQNSMTISRVSMFGEIPEYIPYSSHYLNIPWVAVRSLRLPSGQRGFRR